MIDIHSHVLPLVDDGSTTIQASLNMIKTLSDYGVTDIFLTPHYMRLRNYLSTYQNNLEVLQSFKREVEKAGYQINLHLGNEIFYSIDAIKYLKDKIVTTMGNSKKVLVEFSMTEAEEDISEAIYNLKAAGYIPIIAHPERYQYITEIDDFEIMHKMGALIQINAHSVAGKYGISTQKLCFKLIKLGLVDFVASDIHEFRTNYLKEAYDIVVKKFGENTAESIFCNRVILE